MGIAGIVYTNVLLSIADVAARFFAPPLEPITPTNSSEDITGNPLDVKPSGYDWV
jgi:hypothetical protein